MIMNRKCKNERAIHITRARDRDMLNSVVKNEEVAGPSQRVNLDDDEKDFSSSASSWVPSDGCAESDDSTEIKNKINKLEHYKRQYSNRRSSKKILTPSYKANAVLNMINRKGLHNNNQKSIRNINMNKSVTDSTKKNQNVVQMVTVDAEQLINLEKYFRIVMEMFEDFKRVSPISKERLEVSQVSVTNTDEAITNSYSQQQQPIMDQDQDKENSNENNQSDEFNRSDDNVLISNKYTNAYVKTVQTRELGDDEWVSIGSGMTLIHKDKFKHVNWKSYTIATRTLLLAAFPRRILATHSLTGKRSPAFQDKPAKMCLDPKIISDIVLEVMDRFHVRENLVRSIITTKCADECKMWKTRTGQKKKVKSPKTS